MSKLYQILWALAILFIIITTISFTFVIILVGAAVAGLFGIYRYVLAKKRSKNFKMRPKGFNSSEVIEIPAEIIHVTNQDKKHE